MNRIAILVVLLIAPLSALAQQGSAAANTGYKMGYLIGYLTPIVIVVGLVAWAIKAIFFRKKWVHPEDRRRGW